MAESFADVAPGPLLRALLDAHRLEADAVSYPEIQYFASALASHAHELEAIVWPVGPAAERVAGGATLIAQGELEIGTWNSRLDGRRVLLFAVAGTSPLSLVAAAAQVRSMGAGEVHACGIDVADADTVAVWESFSTLKPARRETRLPTMLRAS